MIIFWLKPSPAHSAGCSPMKTGSKLIFPAPELQHTKVQFSTTIKKKHWVIIKIDLLLAQMSSFLFGSNCVLYDPEGSWTGALLEPTAPSSSSPFAPTTELQCCIFQRDNSRWKTCRIETVVVFFYPTSEGMTRKVSTYIQSNSSSSSVCVWILSSCKDHIKLGTPVLFCFTVYKILTLSHRSVSVGWRRWTTEPHCPLLCQTHHGNTATKQSSQGVCSGSDLR